MRRLNLLIFIALTLFKFVQCSPRIGEYSFEKIDEFGANRWSLDNDDQAKILRALHVGSLWQEPSDAPTLAEASNQQESGGVHQSSTPQTVGNGSPQEREQQYLPEHALHLYDQLSRDTFIVPRSSPFPAVLQICLTQVNVSSVLLFPIEPTPAPLDQLLEAELRIFLPPEAPENKLFNSDFSTVRVFQVVPGQPLEQVDAHRLLAVHTPSWPIQLSGRWLAINVQTAVRDWLSGVRPNLGLFVDRPHYRTPQHLQPLLVVRYGTQAHQGSLSSVSFEIQGWANVSSVLADEIVHSSPGCARLSWQVDLTRVGVLAPATIDLGFCQGSCTLATLPPGLAEYTYILAVNNFHKQNDTQTSTVTREGPCCAPTHYHPAPIMYRDATGNFIIRVLPKLIVKSCSCK